MIYTSANHIDFFIPHLESQFFLYFLFLTKNRWSNLSNRLNQKLLWMRRKRICVNSCTYAWKWEERDGNSGSGKVQEIVLFRCYFHGNWAPRVGPLGSLVAFRCLDSRRAMEHGKKLEENELSDFNSEWKNNWEIGSLFWGKLGN